MRTATFIVGALLIEFVCSDVVQFERQLPITKDVAKPHSWKRTFYLDGVFSFLACENACYFIGNTCYYCESGLYCNEDRSGCCPVPNCRNQCGQYCVKPNYICCKNGKGTCREDYPNCCEEHCCKENHKCCNDGCCKDSDTCCQNGKNEYFCLKKTNALGYCLQGDCVNDNGGKVNYHFEPEVNEDTYFETICKTFANDTRATNPAKRKSQFAALTLGKIEGNDYDPSPVVFELENQTGNYLSAAPLKVGDIFVHSETRILEKLPGAIARYKEKTKSHIVPDLYLFTYLSPCLNCTKQIVESFGEGKSRTYVAWERTYNRLDQTDFLEILKTFFNANIRVAFSFNGLCGKQNDDYVQPLLFKKLYARYEYDGIKTKNCIGMELRGSLIRMTNWLIWKCRQEFTVEVAKNVSGKITTCMTGKLAALKPPINPCMDLPTAIEEVMKEVKEENKHLLLSPPLDPNSGTTTISNDIADLEGNYAEPYFCFQVNYDKPTEE